MRYEVWYGKGQRPVHLADQRAERTGAVKCETERDARLYVLSTTSAPPHKADLHGWTRIVRVDDDGRCTGL